MIGKSIFKAGKLLKITLDYNEQDRTINSIKIEGDFFLHPEDGREKIEEGLKGTSLKKDQLIGRITNLITTNSLEVHGFTSEQLSEAIINATVQA
ncbi:MAG: lipoate protein ligase C-terminal domain-containing protein [Candidatus Micrarchaeota archaeon]